MQFEIWDSDRHKRGEHKISPMVKEVFAIDAYWVREISFHQCSGTRYINHTSRQASCSGVVERYALVFVVVGFFVSYLFLVF